MIALDTSVVMDFLSNNPFLSRIAEKHFRRVRDDGGVISSVLLAELVFLLSRSQNENTAIEAAAFLEQYSLLSIANVTPEIALLAGQLRNKYYHRTKRAMSYLDAIHLATAIKCRADVFITADEDFSGINEIKVEVYR